MADRQDAAAEARHQALQPLAALQVQVRLRLVEQEQLGVLDDGRRQADELALPAAEHAGRQLQLALIQPDLGQHRPDPALEGRSTGPLVPVQQPRLLRQHGLHARAVVVDRWIGQASVAVRQAVVDLAQVRAGVPQRGGRGAIVAQRVLGQHRQPQAALAGDLPGVGLLVTDRDAQQRRLARAIRPDQPDPGAIGQLQVDPAQDLATAEGLGDAAQGEQRHRSRTDRSVATSTFRPVSTAVTRRPARPPSRARRAAIGSAALPSMARWCTCSAQRHGVGDLLLVDHHHLVDQLLAHLPGDAVALDVAGHAIGQRGRDGHRLGGAGLEVDVHRRRGRWLDADQAHARPHGLGPQPDAGDQPAPADRHHEGVALGPVLEHLDRHRSLAGDHVRVAVRLDVGGDALVVAASRLDLDVVVLATEDLDHARVRLQGTQALELGG